MTLAEVMSDAGLKDEARSALSRAYDTISASRDEGLVLSRIARAYAAAGDFDSADRLAVQVANPLSDSLEVETMAYIAVEIGKAGQFDTAKTLISRTLEAALRLKPHGPVDDSKPKICALLANAYGEAGLKDEGVELLAKAESMSKRMQASNSIDQIVASYAKLGQTAKARSLAATIRYMPSKADSFIEIARAYFRAGDSRAGTESLEESFNLTKEIPRETDDFKIVRLIATAGEFARAAQPKRASEVLIYALNEVWRSELPSSDRMADVIKAYARLGLALDGEACGLLKKIIDHEPVPVTPDELEKQGLAEQAGDHFIKRWQETLDLNILFDELYVSNPEQRRVNARLFYGVYRFLAAAGGGPAVDKDVDEKLLREGFFAFWNMWYLRNEYQLSCDQSQMGQLKGPAELNSPFAALRGLKLNQKRIARLQVAQFISLSNRVSAVYRRHLTAGVFTSSRYLENSKEEAASRSKYKKGFRIDRGYSQFGVPDSANVYYLRRGVFEFYFIEENGKLKVLTLRFEL
jgi:tetratricopeptide (TPR) repeat protein